MNEIQKATERFHFQERASLLSSLINAYQKLERDDEALKVLRNFQQDTKALEPRDRISVLPEIVEGYRDLGMSKEAARIVEENFQGIRGHDLSNQVDELIALANANSILNATRSGGSGGSSGLTHTVSPLVTVAVQHVKQNRLNDALKVAATIPYEPDEISALSKILIIWRDVKDMDALEGMFQQVDKRPN